MKDERINIVPVTLSHYRRSVCIEFEEGREKERKILVCSVLFGSESRRIK